MAEAGSPTLDSGRQDDERSWEHSWAEHGWSLTGQDLFCLLIAIAAACALSAGYTLFA